MNIFVDFDHTIAGGHSRGYAMRFDPMDKPNKKFIKQKIADWLSDGHNVIIVTRGVDTHIDMYLDKKLEIEHTMNSFRKGILAVYAPTEETFERHQGMNGTAEFAILKTEYVADFLQKSQTEPKNSIFMDDTTLNVDEMKQQFPQMECIYADPGNYPDTVSIIDTILQRKKQAAGSRKRKSRKKSKSRYSKYLSRW
jgi:hypothetical protein